MFKFYKNLLDELKFQYSIFTKPLSNNRPELHRDKINSLMAMLLMLAVGTAPVTLIALLIYAVFK